MKAKENRNNISKLFKMKGLRTVFVIIGIIACLFATTGTGYSYIDIDQSLEDFPPWIWPIIHPASIFSQVVTAEGVDYKIAADVLHEAATVMVAQFSAGKYEFTDMLTMIDAQFQIQLATIQSAKTKAIGRTKRGNFVAFDDDFECGTPPRPGPWPWPWPWPWTRDLLDLVKMQIESYKTEILTQFDLTENEIEMLDASLGAHYKNFYILLK